MTNEEKKTAQQAAERNAKTKRLLQRLMLWIGVLGIIGLAIYGLMRLGANTRSGSTLQPGQSIPAIDAKDSTRGSSIAKLSLVEYSDFQCPACASYEPLLQEVQKQYAGSVLFAYRHFPLPQHQNALIAATATEAAGKQGKFWEMHDLLFARQGDWANVSKSRIQEVFVSYASQIALNAEQFKKDLADPATATKVTSDQTIGAAAGIDSTPTFFLNGKLITPNPANLEEFKELIEAALKNN